MEELIRWIIIIAVIYSFLKGIFQKKKPETDKTQAGREIPGRETLSSGTTVPQTNRSRTELTLEDIFGKLPDNKPAEQNIPVKKENKDEYAYTSNKYSENNSFDSPVDYDRGQKVSREKIIAEKIKENAGENKKRKRELSKKPEILNTVMVYSGGETNIAANVRKMIGKPETLREIFIMSEILNKPKAFRKW
jgi:hypothetical protein